MPEKLRRNLVCRDAAVNIRPRRFLRPNAGEVRGTRPRVIARTIRPRLIASPRSMAMAATTNNTVDIVRATITATAPRSSGRGTAAGERNELVTAR